MACQGILPVRPVVVEMPLHASGRAHVIGVLRLRNCFAERSSYCAQDDRVVEERPFMAALG